MIISEAKYMGSFPSLALCPPAKQPEYAFIGRSNVGKSSLINMICEKKGLARISNKPGKTQNLNFYLMNDEWFLVDMPGYGYAATAQKNRKAWSLMISDYLLQRPTLQCAFVLMDATVPPQTLDVEFTNWLGEEEIPFVIAYTKTDKLSNARQFEHIHAIQKMLGETWNELPQEFVTSSLHKKGREEMLDFIEKVNKSV